MCSAFFQRQRRFLRILFLHWRYIYICFPLASFVSTYFHPFYFYDSQIVYQLNYLNECSKLLKKYEHFIAISLFRPRNEKMYE